MTRHVWIVGYDFSDSAEAALEHAAGLLKTLDGRLVIVHAVEPPNAALRRKLSKHTKAFEVLDSVADALLEVAGQALARRSAQLLADYAGLDLSHMARIGDPVDVLVGAAKQVEATNIAVGSRGLRGLKRVFLGSVTKHVLREADIPVVVVKATPEEVSNSST